MKVILIHNNDNDNNLPNDLLDLNNDRSLKVTLDRRLLSIIKGAIRRNLSFLLLNLRVLRLDHLLILRFFRINLLYFRLNLLYIRLDLGHLSVLSNVTITLISLLGMVHINSRFLGQTENRRRQRSIHTTKLMTNNRTVKGIITLLLRLNLLFVSLNLHIIGLTLSVLSIIRNLNVLINRHHVLVYSTIRLNLGLIRLNLNDVRFVNNFFKDLHHANTDKRTGGGYHEDNTRRNLRNDTTQRLLKGSKVTI